jgi:hypothetical protein
MRPRLSKTDRIEYVVRQSADIWLIEHAGDSYGPYKDRREAMFFAIDAAHKLGELGKNTHVRVTDPAGHPRLRLSSPGFERARDALG